MTSRKAPRLRNAEFVDQRQSRQMQSMVAGTLEGRQADAQPFKQFSGPPDALFGFDGGAVTQATRASQIDQFTLASAGAQDLTLTFVPVDMSWNVEHNTLGLLDTVNYTIASNVLSLISGVDSLEIGDTIQVQYDYLEEQADPVEDNTLELFIPFGSGGWKYTTTDPGAGWEAPSFDDSAWTVGPMPIGNTGWAGGALSTTITQDNLWVRRLVAPGTGITVEYHEARYYHSYADGTLVQTRTTGAYATSNVTDHDFPDQGDAWVLAAWIHDFSAPGQSGDIGLDMEVDGTPL